ncbi:MAG: hypothetical protein WC621_02895 [Patescibacteria group bacterium]
MWPVLLTKQWLNKKLLNRRTLIPLLIPPLGLVAFSVYLYYLVGDPLAWLHGQTLAARHLVWPHKLLAGTIHNVLTQGDRWLVHLSELAALGLVLICLPKLWRLDKSYALLAVLTILPSLFSDTLGSLPRFILAILPIFIVISQLKNKWLWYLYLAISIPLLILSVARFVNWQWVS